MSGFQRFIVGYWLIGCVMVGAVEAQGLKECPLDRHPITVQDIIFPAIWPAVFGMLLNHSPSTPIVCHGPEAKS
jgi:hypothetical protein